MSQQFTTVLRELGVEYLLCMPFASEQKGTIERALKTMSHGILDLLPGFIGHNVAERKVIEARKSFAQRVMTPGETIEVSLTAAELQKRLDEWSEHLYARASHEGEGMDGQSPWAKAQALKQPVHRIEDERALDMLLCELGGTRTVTKKGLRFERAQYIDPLLCLHAEHTVTIRRDAGDMGRLYVYAAEDSEEFAAGEFICVAKNPELTGISRQQVAGAARHLQRELNRAHGEEHRQLRARIKQDPVQAIIEHAIAQSRNVTRLPPRSTPYSTQALEQTGRAARAGKMPAPKPWTAAEKAYHEKINAEIEAAASVVEVHDPDGSLRHYRWVRIGRRIEAGEAVKDDDRTGWERYRVSDDYRFMERICADFGMTIDQVVGSRAQALPE